VWAGGPWVALLYRRVSGKEQKLEGLSLPAQEADGRRYFADQAERHGWVLGGEFEDVMKGRRDDRPRYQEMLGLVRRLRAEGKNVVIVVKWLHRLGRKVSESVRCREELKALGVPIHSVMEGGEVSDLVANIMASVAEYEVDQLGERVAEVIDFVRSNGWHVPGRPTWGYRSRPATEEERAQGSPKGVLDTNPAEARWAAELLTRASKGEAVRSLARWAAALPPEARGGRRMSRETIITMLRSATYVARHEPDDPVDDPHVVLALPRCRWPSLVDDQTWLRVQEQLASHSRLPRQASGEYLLTGFLRCPRPGCGGRPTGRHRHGGPARPRYGCPGSPTAACTFTCLASGVDAAVLGQVGGLLDAFSALRPVELARVRRAYDALRRPAGADAREAARQVRDRERKRESLRVELAEAARMLVRKELDGPGYQSALEQIVSEVVLFV
jgi:DNA invertase Pin-like site-specific DNA recombinase